MAGRRQRPKSARCVQACQRALSWRSLESPTGSILARHKGVSDGGHDEHDEAHTARRAHGRARLARGGCGKVAAGERRLPWSWADRAT